MHHTPGKSKRGRTTKSRPRQRVAPKSADGLVEFTPLSLLATILKCVLKDRITDDECTRICGTYYQFVQGIWGDEE